MEKLSGFPPFSQNVKAIIRTVDPYLPKCTVYEAQVTISDKRVLCYGTSDGEFKTRFNTHTRSFRHKTDLQGKYELLHTPHTPY